MSKFRHPKKARFNYDRRHGRRKYQARAKHEKPKPARSTSLLTSISTQHHQPDIEAAKAFHYSAPSLKTRTLLVGKGCQNPVDDVSPTKSKRPLRASKPGPNISAPTISNITVATCVTSSPNTSRRPHNPPAKTHLYYSPPNLPAVIRFCANIQSDSMTSHAFGLGRAGIMSCDHHQATVACQSRRQRQ